MRASCRRFPHVPGIDVAGVVVESTDERVGVGQRVLVTSYELGVERWGGWAQYVRVPADWVVLLPTELSLRDSMVLGTAGLTAGLCVRALQQHEVQPSCGDVIVTGATGGVGSLAVSILAQAGYRVAAVTGKQDRAAWLQSLGAAQVVDRSEVLAGADRPLNKARWAGAIDTVGGPMLAALLPSIRNEGCVAACGVVGGAEFNTSMYPFILRGVTLRGIDSAWCSRSRREEIWTRLSQEWRLPSLDQVSHSVTLNGIDEVVRQLLAGEHVGRTIVDLQC